jgi:glutamate-ammonia-ligase adenylyltransferase
VIGPNLETAIESSAAPATVRVAVDRLMEAYPDLMARVEEHGLLRDALVAVTAASRSLTEVCLTEPAALDVLGDLDRRPAPGPERPVRTGSTEVLSVDSLGRWKRLELLRIAARDLIGLDDLAAVGQGLATLAGEVFEGACSLADPSGLAVIGMGKLGGAELNYASDVDVMFVADDPSEADRSARTVMEIVRSMYRVDVDLRPEGRSGPLVRSLESYEAYWDRWAQTWEFQALIKARPVAGDRDVGGKFFERAQDRLWSRPFMSDDLRAVRHMKARAEGEMARKGLTDREVKRGRGGIRDIEFAIQLLQLVHGRDDAALRSPTTLEVLAELGRAGYVEHEDAATLDHAYRLLRAVEHRLQLVQEQQVHALPTDPAGWTRLARVMGYRDSPERTAGELLAGELRHRQAVVRSIHEQLFFRPLLDALSARAPDPQSPAGVEPGLSHEAVVARLSAFGFTEAERTRQALKELTGGLTRSSRLMRQMLPLLLDWLSESPDPDLGLLGLRLLTSERHRAGELAVAFRESPEAARRLCLLAGTSRRLTETLEHQPDLIPALGETEALSARSPDALMEGATAALVWRGEVEERQRGLQRFQRREELRIAACDILDLDRTGTVADEAHDPVVLTAGRLTALAEASVEAALGAMDPPLPFAVVAMGRFGGGELSYASDLDVLFVYDGATAEDFAVAEKTAESLLQFLSGRTPVTRVYTVDAGLRPEGKDGPLARSLDGYRSYYDRWALAWERQALVRARIVAGDRDVGRELLDIVRPHVWRDPFPEADVREIRRMKARIERERLPAGADPQFHLKLGRGSLSDVEFCAQLLQLQHRVPATGTMEAVRRLQDAGVIGRWDGEALAEAYRFCERTRNRWFLIKGAPDDSLPTRPEQLARLARSLGTTTGDLREDYRRATRRSRQVVERLFYGKDQ